LVIQARRPCPVPIQQHTNQPTTHPHTRLR
jgi:hypothetical protein